MLKKILILQRNNSKSVPPVAAKSPKNASSAFSGAALSGRFLIDFAIIAVLLMCSTAFANTAVIENSGVNRYKSVRLTPEIYNNANSDLSDLRILNANGEHVPYFVHDGYQTDYREASRYRMSLIDAYVKDDNFYFDYALTEQPNRDIIATAVEFTTSDTTFAKNADVFGSYDNIHWEFIQRDQLYRVSDKSKLEIIFNTPQKFTHYRFRLNNNLERISFSTAALTYSLATTQRRYFIESITPSFRTEEDENSTYIYVEGLKNLRLSEIIIDTESMFQRIVTAPSFGIHKELYNLSFNDTNYRDTSIPFNRNMGDEETLLLIHNGDDRPIIITGITVKYYTEELVFEGSGETYTLRFGADENARPPVYDITRYKDEILRGDIDRLVISQIALEEIQPAPEPQQYDFRGIFNMVIIAVALMLGSLIIFKLLKK